MVMIAMSSISIGVIQSYIDRDISMLIKLESSDILRCDQKNASKCVSGMWQFIPYLLLTCGEILFSISGINLAYQEVGNRTKASASSMWLLTVAIGNLLVKDKSKCF